MTDKKQPSSASESGRTPSSPGHEGCRPSWDGLLATYEDSEGVLRCRSCEQPVIALARTSVSKDSSEVTK